MAERSGRYGRYGTKPAAWIGITVVLLHRASRTPGDGGPR